MKKTIVELDLVGYGNLVKILEENLDAKIVPYLNEQIQEFVNAGLIAVGKTREEVVMANNGDNAVIVFDDANHAHTFAEAVHQATQLHNNNKTEPSAKRWFRIGAATGELAQEGNSKLTGYVIVRAYRLEADAKPGEFLVDLDTYDAFLPELQQKYGSKETVSGKYNESFSARRCKMIDSALTTTATEATVIGVLDLFDQLEPRDQILRAMTIINMPQEHRPPDTLTIFQRQEKILDWAANNNKLKELQEALSLLIEKSKKKQYYP